jgi:Uma2 family endonuclease
VKAALYATMGVPEYWIINLVDNLVERHTEPHDGHYLRVEPAGAEASLALVKFPDVTLNARDFLPL